MADQSTNKVITLETLEVVVDKIKEDYPTREEMEQEISTMGGTIEYATEEEVLALFEDTSGGNGGETPTE